MSRRRYLVYGLVIESDLPLTSVDEVTDSHTEVAITIVRGVPDDFLAPEVKADADDWIQHVVLPDDRIYVRIGDLVETIVSSDGRRAVFQPLGQPDERSLEANLLNFVVAIALTLKGEEPLHATVVDLGGRVVALLGSSGAGKSTLAACLIAQGAELITDDMLRLVLLDGKALVYPGPYRLKLFDETAQRLLPEARKHGAFNTLSGKYMVRPGKTIEPSRGPRLVSALFYLGDPDAVPEPATVSLSRLSGAALARNLIAAAMNTRYHRADRLVRQFRFSEQVAHALPFYQLSYPRRFEVIPQVIEEIRRAAGLVNES
jgi:energy-coupling factor transporter ATP-binding protein EcfA2